MHQSLSELEHSTWESNQERTQINDIKFKKKIYIVKHLNMKRPVSPIEKFIFLANVTEKRLIHLLGGVLLYTHLSIRLTKSNRKYE